jgi:hypothetical protein
LAVAEMSAARGLLSRWAAGLGVALAFAAAGGGVWYLAETLLGRIEPLQPFIAVASLSIGGLAGYGALIGTGRLRGWRTQAIGVVVSIPVLAVSQALVTRLVFVRELETLGYGGATFRLPLREWWEYVSWALFTTSPPSILFWALAIGYAIAVPRTYSHEEADYR